MATISNKPAPAPAARTWFGWAYDCVKTVAETVHAYVVQPVIDAAKTAYLWCAFKVASIGASLPTIGFYLVAGVASVLTVWLFVASVSSIIVPLVGITVAVVLMKDIGGFVSGYKTGEAQAEAVARTAMCALTGTVMLAAMMTSAPLGGIIVSLVVSAMLYKVACDKAGRFEIENRWEPKSQQVLVATP